MKVGDIVQLRRMGRRREGMIGLIVGEVKKRLHVELADGSVMGWEVLVDGELRFCRPDQLLDPIFGNWESLR